MRKGNKFEDEIREEKEEKRKQEEEKKERQQAFKERANLFRAPTKSRRSSCRLAQLKKKQYQNRLYVKRMMQNLD